MIRCVIIDDEPAAIEILKEYVTKINFLELVISFRDPIEALAFCQQQKVDLILLDINMPNLNGLQFYKALSYKPPLIFTTAYTEFAVESYEVKAIDYLLKPISFDRFMMAVSRVFEKDKEIVSANKIAIQNIKNQQTIYVKSGYELHQLDLVDILFLEKDANYLIFHTKTKKVLSRMNMRDAFDIVPEIDFIQIHKSYIIAWIHIDIVEAHQITIGNQHIPIGVSYREEFQKKFKSLH